MSQFVPLTEEDPALWLVVLLNVYQLPADQRAARRAELSRRLDTDEADEELMAAKMTKLGKLADKKKIKTMIQEYLLPDNILTDLISGDPSECESCFGLVFYLLSSMPADKAKLKVAIIKKMTTALSSEKLFDESSADTRIRYLTSLFSIAAGHCEQRFKVLEALLKVCLKTNRASALVGKLAGVDSWLNAWAEDVSHEKRATLLKLVAEVHLAAVGVESSVTRHFLLKYLRAVQGLGKEAVDAAAEYAARAILLIVKETATPADATSGSNTSDFDEIMGFDAVNALAEKKQYSALHRLLKIFAGEDVKQFNEWATKNKKVIKEHGLDEESLKSQMRTLTLCSLGAKSNCLSYSQLQTELDVSSELEVEAAVVDAVTTGRVTAKIDQEKEQVSILRVEPRQITQVNWNELDDKLQSWKGLVKKSCDYIQVDIELEQNDALDS